MSRALIAFGLVLLAAAWVLAEPLGKGPFLVSITSRHGIDLGDLPAVALLAVAAAVIVWPRRR